MLRPHEPDGIAAEQPALGRADVVSGIAELPAAGRSAAAPACEVASAFAGAVSMNASPERIASIV